MKFRLSLVLLASCLLLSANLLIAQSERGANSLKSTSGSSPASKTKLADIRSASIDKNVKVAKNMEIRGATQVMLGSLLGGLVSEATKAEPRKKYKAIMDKAGIDIGSIFYTEFTNVYMSKKPLGPGKGKDATIKLEVEEYGFIQAPSGFERIKPVAVGLVEIFDSQNKRIWSDQAQVSTWAEQTPGGSHEEYMSNPGLLREHFSQTFKVLSERIVTQMALEKK